MLSALRFESNDCPSWCGRRDTNPCGLGLIRQRNDERGSRQFWVLLKIGAGGRGRTDTPFGNTILSRARLPIPPHRLGGLIASCGVQSQGNFVRKAKHFRLAACGSIDPFGSFFLAAFAAFPVCLFSACL